MRARAPSIESDVVENYLKAIHALSQRSAATVPPAGDNGSRRTRVPRGAKASRGRSQRPRGAALVLMGDLASSLALTPGTVTSMVKRLARRGLVRYERYGGVALTAQGERAALAVLRRHRIVETWLVQMLGLDWSEVHDEAERLEHVLSDRVLEALDRALGRPEVDPHGDPIPPAPLQRGVPLASCAPGSRVQIDRLLEQSRGFLQFASRHGLTPGATLAVLALRAGKGVVRVRTGHRGAVTLDGDLASRVLVTPINPPRRGSRRTRRE